MKKLPEDPLSVLEVIDRLEVGPLKLQRKRLIMPYKVIQKGKEDTFNFIYHFEEEVFNPREPASLNLASIMGVQVAVNYGLFCKEIVFSGLFDQIDHQFIKEMMLNTAREIYVKKFLEPNPFLRGQAAHLPVVKKDNYLRANLVFHEKSTDTPNKKTKNRDLPSWIVDHSLQAVLSSGGKDSLLSFCLLQEIGKETHPIFLNESGRHWYTALNAYRYLKEHYPETGRVWTNSDRLFAWMLRHFPFIRQDFARLRSDEYPIRLWTVAVFLFGALPLLRKRGIGRLVIGDEFDTTRRISHKGITHYDGLYDQSRYFDNALTRYYQRKGWNLVQFSVIRPLSELLIETILVQRYPYLQRHQVSCHAAHIEGNRVRPCGNCEKCRRIVGMLMAIGADPSNCGYTKKQIEHCLEVLGDKGAHQETTGVQHLTYLLTEKGLIQSDSSPTIKPKARAEIMKVRIDPEKSPLDGIPVELRQPLLAIFLQHAQGAVKRKGRIWIDYDPLSDPLLSRPYPFESTEGMSGNELSPSSQRSKLKASYLLDELTWPEAQARFKEVDVALLPVGSLEQHGLHLPLDTDAFDAYYLATQVAAACSNPKPLVLPLIPYGVSYHHDDFRGTLSVSPKTLFQLVYDVGMSAVKNGITKLVIINGHGGNIPALQFAAQMINRDAHIFTCVETGETSAKDVLEITDTPNDVHAGEIETSTTLATRPEMVRVDKIKKFIPRFSIRYLNFSSKRSVEWYARVAKISPSGVLGDPTKASAEKGEKIWAVMIQHLVEFVEDLKTMSLDEILHKRY